MHPRRYYANASLTPPPVPANPSEGFPKVATPGSPEATVPGAYWFYKIGEEFYNLFVQAGITPDDTNLSQLYQSLQALYAPIDPA